jgi:hypothetical protein
LVLIARAFFGGIGGFAAWFFAEGLFLGLTGSGLFLIGGLFFYQALLGPCFHGWFGFAEFGDAVFAALDFPGGMVRPSCSGVSWSILAKRADIRSIRFIAPNDSVNLFPSPTGC